MIVSASGHRDIDYYVGLEKCKIQVGKLIDEGCCVFVGGGAGGWDTCFTNAVHQVIKERKIRPSAILNILALPHMGYLNENKFDEFNDLNITIVYVDRLQKYQIEGIPVNKRDVKKYFKRNDYLIDMAKVMLVCYDGRKKGGTYDTYKKAKKQNIRILRTNPKSW